MTPLDAAGATRRPAPPRARSGRAGLSHALLGLCRGSTVVLPQDRELVDALRSAGLDRVVGHAVGALAGLPAESVRSLVLLELLPADDAAAAALLLGAWERVKPGGRLIVVAPNAASHPTPGARTRKGLARLLQPLGRPKVHGEQPFRWLLMHVKKPHPGEAPVPPAVEARYRVLAELCRGRVLELGCGPGHLAARIAARGHEVVGMDMNAAKVRQATERYPGVRFFRGDAAELDLGDERFETVMIAEVLEHVPAAAGERILAAAGRALLPGGRLVVSVPNEKCIPHPNHVRVFDARGLRSLLRPFGVPALVSEQPYKWLVMYVDCDS